MKRCLACGEVLPFDAFYRQTSGGPKGTGSRDGLRPTCRACHLALLRAERRRRVAAGHRHVPTCREMYSGAARRAAVRGLSFTLSFEAFSRLWSQPCHYCGALVRGVGIDRVDNGRGYEPDNVVPCCWLCNSWKSVLTVAEFRERVGQLYQRLVLGRTDIAASAVPQRASGRSGRDVEQMEFEISA